MAHGQGATSGRTPRSRGAYGSTRGKERQRRKRDAREQQARNAQAAEETEAARKALEDLIAEQEKNPAMGETEGARYARERREREEALAQAERDEIEVAAEEARDPEEVGTIDLPVRPCHKVAKREEHLAHEWERGGLKIKTVCNGFSIKAPEFAEPVVVPMSEVAPEIPDTGEGFWQFAYTTARMMLKQGYNIRYVCEFTGVGKQDLSDIPVDRDGYGIVEKKDDHEDQ